MLEETLVLFKNVRTPGYKGDLKSYQETGGYEALKKALENSTSVVLAIDNEAVVGLARSMSDDVSIHYLQDILVNPTHQREGIGRALLDWTKKRYENVKIHMLLTDDEEKQHKFYKSFDYKNTKDLKKHNLNAFVRMNNLTLE